MKYFFHISFCLFFLIACSENKEEVIPSEIIQTDTMAMIIADMHILESISNFRGMMDSQGFDKIEEQYVNIFSRHKISAERFRNSYDYYLEKPERMDKVYEQVLEQLSKVQAELRPE